MSKSGSREITCLDICRNDSDSTPLKEGYSLPLPDKTVSIGYWSDSGEEKFSLNTNLASQELVCIYEDRALTWSQWWSFVDTRKGSAITYIYKKN